MAENEADRAKRMKTDSTPSKDFINYFSEPLTLQHIVAVSIAVRLWTDVRSEMNQFTNFCELEARLLNRMFNSSLSLLLKTEVSYVIRSIKLQLLKLFSEYSAPPFLLTSIVHALQDELSEFYMNGGSVHWTTEGTIDMVKSLKNMFNNESLEKDLCFFYKASCFYCLEESISDLWEKIPAQEKSKFRMAAIDDKYEHHIILYWISVLEDKLGSFLTRIIRIDHKNIYEDNLTIDLNMVTCSVSIGNISALKYFWKKLTEQEKKDNLKKWLFQCTRIMRHFDRSAYELHDEFLDVMCFLLSHVNDKIQLIEFFQNHSFLLKLLFHSCSFQRYFLPTILMIIDNMEKDVYVSIIEEIGLKVSEGRSEIKFFREVWKVSPSRLKKSFFQNQIGCYRVILNLLQKGEVSMAVTLLSDVSEEEKGVYVSIMGDIAAKMSKEGIEITFFKEMWNVSTLSLKRSFLNEKLRCCSVILNLLKIGEPSVAIKLLGDVSEEDKYAYVSMMEGVGVKIKELRSGMLVSFSLKRSFLPKENHCA